MYKFIILSMLIATPALAQEPPADVKVNKSSTSFAYTVRMEIQDDVDTTKACAERVDVTPSLELGCVPAVANQVVTLEVAIPKTQRQDAEIRGFAYDTDGNKSDPSPNAGFVDFTPPKAPKVN